MSPRCVLARDDDLRFLNASVFSVQMVVIFVKISQKSIDRSRYIVYNATTMCEVFTNLSFTSMRGIGC